ncbi:hypothetical protein LO772_23050 [Yinghuangia sp. ASG 101]|uniref:hypothetical protein n=1 Tax=Yinghuangia sp. ASG 101 TaxID=2896848 RepID=UPI001E3DB9A6|nr:hypothetical protein [Yinghuangia sp. ASG 101]UGQ09770.1 hypothetical protein LO772_23050 [Yinghuangia sp. ASG 101]
MRTRTPAVKAALVTAVLGALALTACELPGQKDKDDAAASTAASPSAAAPASDEPANEPTPRGEPPVTRTPSGSPTGKGSATATSTAAGARGPRVLISAGFTAGYERLSGPGMPTDVPVDPGEMTDDNNLVVAAYGKSADAAREVLFVGVDGLTAVDGKRMEHMIRGMIDYVNGDGGSVPQGVSMQAYAAGPLGGTLECMPAQDAYPAAICAWADTNTVAVAYFDKLSADAAAVRFAEMRTDMEK